MKPRTLVIILGQARAHQLTWSSFKRNLLDELDADLALCVGESPDHNDSNPYWANAKFRWTVPEYDDFGDGFDQIQLDRYGAITNWREILRVRDQWLGGIKGPGEQPGSAGILVYFRAKLYEFLIKGNIAERYDRFIITRSDFIWEVPHCTMDRLNPGFIWIPYGEFYGGVTDRHVILAEEHLRPYLDLIDPIFRDAPQLISDMLEYNPKPNWNLERYILFRLRSLDLERKIRFVPYMMYAVRDEATGTRWSQGEFDQQLGYYVKYRSEKKRADLTRKYLTAKSGKVILLPSFLMKPLLDFLFSKRLKS